MLFRVVLAVPLPCNFLVFSTCVVFLCWPFVFSLAGFSSCDSVLTVAAHRTHLHPTCRYHKFAVAFAGHFLCGICLRIVCPHGLYPATIQVNKEIGALRNRVPNHSSSPILAPWTCRPPHCRTTQRCRGSRAPRQTRPYCPSSALHLRTL